MQSENKGAKFDLTLHYFWALKKIRLKNRHALSDYSWTKQTL